MSDIRRNDIVILRRSKDLIYRSYYVVEHYDQLNKIVHYRRCTTSSIPTTYVHKTPAQEMLKIPYLLLEKRQYIRQQMDKQTEHIVEEEPFYLYLKCTINTINLLGTKNYGAICLFENNEHHKIHQMFEILNTPHKVHLNKLYKKQFAHQDVEETTDEWIKLIVGRMFFRYV